jgi:hypothetical protein
LSRHIYNIELRKPYIIFTDGCAAHNRTFYITNNRNKGALYDTTVTMYAQVTTYVK